MEGIPLLVLALWQVTHSPAKCCPYSVSPRARIDSSANEVLQKIDKRNKKLKILITKFKTKFYMLSMF